MGAVPVGAQPAALNPPGTAWQGFPTLGWTILALIVGRPCLAYIVPWEYRHPAYLPGYKRYMWPVCSLEDRCYLFNLSVAYFNAYILLLGGEVFFPDWMWEAPWIEVIIEICNLKRLDGEEVFIMPSCLYRKEFWAARWELLEGMEERFARSLDAECYTNSWGPFQPDTVPDEGLPNGLPPRHMGARRVAGVSCVSVTGYRN